MQSGRQEWRWQCLIGFGGGREWRSECYQLGKRRERGLVFHCQMSLGKFHFKEIPVHWLHTRRVSGLRGPHYGHSHSFSYHVVSIGNRIRSLSGKSAAAIYTLTVQLSPLLLKETVAIYIVGKIHYTIP